MREKHPDGESACGYCLAGKFDRHLICIVRFSTLEPIPVGFNSESFSENQENCSRRLRRVNFGRAY